MAPWPFNEGNYGRDYAAKQTLPHPIIITHGLSGRTGEDADLKEELAGPVNPLGNRLGLPESVKLVRVSRDSWNCAVLQRTPAPVIEVEMTTGTLESAPPGGVLGFK